MSEQDGLNRSLLIVKSKPDSLIQVENFLSNRDWRIGSTGEVKQILDILIHKKPQFIMIPMDHPNPRIVNLPKVIAQAFPVCVFYYLEDLSGRKFNLLREVKSEYVLYPPVTGPAIQRMAFKYQRKMEIDARTQNRRSQRAMNSNDPQTSDLGLRRRQRPADGSPEGGWDDQAELPEGESFDDSSVQGFSDEMQGPESRSPNAQVLISGENLENDQNLKKLEEALLSGDMAAATSTLARVSGENQNLQSSMINFQTGSTSGNNKENTFGYMPDGTPIGGPQGVIQGEASIDDPSNPFAMGGADSFDLNAYNLPDRDTKTIENEQSLQNLSNRSKESGAVGLGGTGGMASDPQFKSLEGMEQTGTRNKGILQDESKGLSSTEMDNLKGTQSSGDGNSELDSEARGLNNLNVNIEEKGADSGAGSTERRSSEGSLTSRQNLSENQLAEDGLSESDLKNLDSDVNSKRREIEGGKLTEANSVNELEGQVSQTESSNSLNNLDKSGGESKTLDDKNLAGLMKTNAPAAEALPEAPKEKVSATAQLHKSKIIVTGNEIDDRPKTILEAGAMDALDNVVRKSLPSKQAIQDTSNVACIVVNSTKFSGYLIAAMGKNKSIDAHFVRKIQDRLLKFLATNGEPIAENENLQMKIKQVDFEPWAMEQAQFLRKSVHNGDDIAMAFFPRENVVQQYGESASEEMATVRLEEIEDDIEVECNLYIYMPTNKKYILYTPKGGKLYKDQKGRLKGKGVGELHLLKVDLADFSKFKAQNYLNDKISEFESGQKKKKTSSKKAI